MSIWTPQASQIRPKPSQNAPQIHPEPSQNPSLEGSWEGVPFISFLFDFWGRFLEAFGLTQASIFAQKTIKKSMKILMIFSIDFRMDFEAKTHPKTCLKSMKIQPEPTTPILWKLARHVGESSIFEGAGR